MASIELRPGDTLNIVWKSLQDTPIGKREVESSFAFSYDELVQRLRAKTKIAKSRRSGTDGARFSRMVALATNALRKGTWSTGAEIDRSEVFNKLLQRFHELPKEQYPHITPHATQALKELALNATYLSPSQKTKLAQTVALLP